jgi:quinol monooxygenase YgiN
VSCWCMNISLAANAGLVAALIAAAASLVIALMNAGFALYGSRETRGLNRTLSKEQGRLQREMEVLKDDLARETKRQEREASAKAELDRAREPLLAAAVDLADRLHNIRHGLFLAYFSSDVEHRAENARLGTLFRFARFWCIVETLYDRVTLVQFRGDEATRPVAAKLRQIGRTCASDRYDNGRLMMWREEQRAIAERMRVETAPLGCIGFATFVDQYKSTFERWFSSFERDLDASASSERFKDLQQQLAELASQLDEEKMYEEQWRRALEGAITPVG